jgi:hypothetical protein
MRIQNLLTRTTAMLVLACAALLAASPVQAFTPDRETGSPSAAAPGDQYQRLLLQNRATGMCLDSNWEGWVYTNPCNSNNIYQHWYASYAGAGVSRFFSGASGRYLDSNYDGSVYTLLYNGGPHQVWYKYASGALVNYQTHRCLDSYYDKRVYTLPCSGFNNLHQ